MYEFEFPGKIRETKRERKKERKSARIHVS
jgi:hypothetical protein